VFGVGTSVVTGSGYPAAGLVYKLVEHVDDAGNWVSVAKRSPEKSNPAGRKSAYRSPVAETVFTGTPKPDASMRALEVTFIDNGDINAEWRGAAGVATARDYHLSVRAELSEAALRLSPGDPALPTVVR
jgi:nicotinate phosphoribosyltransferase